MTQSGSSGAEGVQEAFRADEHGDEPSSPPAVSQEEREAVSPTDTSAATPLGVGESRTEGSEEIGGKEAGRQDTGTEGETQRPSGTSTGRDVTGINPSESGTMESDAI
jgi:hypothetical protein